MRPEGAEPSDQSGATWPGPSRPTSGPAFEERMALCAGTMTANPALCHLSYYN